MFEGKVKRIRLSIEQVQSLRAACGLEPSVSMMAARTRHLVDEEFIEYFQEPFPNARREWVTEHLTHCPACRNEIARWSALAAAWKGEETRHRVMERLAARSAPAKAAERASFIDSHPVLLRSLLLPQGAFGEGGKGEVAQVDFVVTDGGRVVEGLLGTLQRRNREYYARVLPDPAADSAHLQQRRVVLTITNPGEKRPLLQRTLEVGVTVLLGTDLRLTQQSILQAELLSDTPAEETQAPPK